MLLRNFNGSLANSHDIDNVTDMFGDNTCNSNVVSCWLKVDPESVGVSELRIRFKWEWK